MGRKTINVDPKHPQMDLERRLIVHGDIDRGGASVVKRALDVNLLRHVAQKKILPQYARLKSMRGRLIEEAQITSQLNHPNIVSVHELGVDEAGDLYFTMDLLEGRTFKAILDEKNCLERTSKELFEHLQIFLKICEAVAFAHSHGVLHRDLKPSNVMVADFGAVYVVDWGLARKKQRAHSPDFATTVTQKKNGHRYSVESKHPLGTWSYMAPEQALGDESALDERTDVFQLGGVLYEILTHCPPYNAKSLEELRLKVADGCIDWPYERTTAYLSPQLCRITMKALMRSKEDRYQSVVEMKEAVEKYMYDGGQFEVRRFRKGELIIKERDDGDEAYIIVKGRCQAFLGTGPSKKILREMVAGEAFGETAVLTDDKRTASVEALEPTEVMVITVEDFEEGVKWGAWLGKFLKVLATRFKEKDAKVNELESASRMDVSKSPARP